MALEDLSKNVLLELPIGQLIVIWDLLSNKLSGEPVNKVFTEEEKRAIWALEDLCENVLIENDITSKPEPEWNALVQKAREFMKAIPVDFLD